MTGIYIRVAVSRGGGGGGDGFSAVQRRVVVIAKGHVARWAVSAVGHKRISM